MTTKSPIAILSFNRPQYLERTLQSLRGQITDDREVHLFQDGGFNPLSGRNYADEGHILENIRIFQKLFPHGAVHIQPVNIGIARNFDTAERFFFDEHQHQAAIFLEDDMVLGPHYMAIMDRMLIPTAISNPRIGCVAAYGNHLAPIQAQHSNSRAIIDMDHRWGFALTRRQWLRQKPFVDEYLGVIANTDYQCRNHHEIVNWFISKKVVPFATSQDSVKGAFQAMTGATSLMTFCCFAQYIGKLGVHFREGDFEKHGFQNTQLYPSIPDAFDWPTDEDIDSSIAKSQAQLVRNVAAVERIFPFYKNSAKVSSEPPLDAALQEDKKEGADVQQPDTTKEADVVAELYRGILGREPDKGGLVSSVDILRANGLAATARTLIRSKEFQQITVRSNTGTPTNFSPPSVPCISLGHDCHAAELLKGLGCRQEAYPFDWIFSSPKMVAHAITTDFEHLLDRSFHHVGEGHAVDHTYYRENFGIRNMFNHHDTSSDDGFSYLSRCVDRFRSIRDQQAAARFVFLGVDALPEDLNAMWGAISPIFPAASFLGLSLRVHKKNVLPRYSEIDVGPSHVIAEFHSRSAKQPLNFSDVVDNAALAQIVADHLSIASG